MWWSWLFLRWGGGITYRERYLPNSCRCDRALGSFVLVPVISCHVVHYCHQLVWSVCRGNFWPTFIAGFLPFYVSFHTQTRIFCLIVKHVDLVSPIKNAYGLIAFTGISIRSSLTSTLSLKISCLLSVWYFSELNKIFIFIFSTIVTLLCMVFSRYKRCVSKDAYVGPQWAGVGELRGCVVKANPHWSYAGSKWVCLHSADSSFDISGSCMSFLWESPLWFVYRKA